MGSDLLDNAIRDEFSKKKNEKQFMEEGGGTWFQGQNQRWKGDKDGAIYTLHCAAMTYQIKRFLGECPFQFILSLDKLSPTHTQSWFSRVS